MKLLHIIISALLLNVAFATGGYAQEELSVLCIGNSFTFFHDSNKRLAEIAASQGHPLKVEAAVVGGYTFHRHLINDATMNKLIYNRYDRVFLQDQSQSPALYGQSPKRCHHIVDDAVELAERVRCYSPNAKIWIEQTWAFSAGDCGGFGTMEEFDRLLRKGTKMMAKKAKTEVSPIGEAFIIVRNERPDIDLYDPDKKHQSALGTYLKACVNYLMLFPTPFNASATDCGYDSEKCAYLRSVAERVVL